jgi:hypothetical protein
MLKQKRVAVCFSGQIRDWQFAKKNILKFFSTPNQEEVTVDYFIHTWDTNSWRLSGNRRHEVVDEKHNDFGGLVKIYSPAGVHMSVYKSIEWESAWDPLFYSFEYSMLLKKQYELENNFVYDIVIKARPDTVYNPANRFPFHQVNRDGSCYAASHISRFPSEFNMQYFDDIMFFGDSKTMDIMSGLYKYYALKNRDSRNLEKTTMQIDINTELHLGPGTLLYQYAVKHNIHPDAYEIDYAIIRSTMRGKGLDSVDDYDKIKKLCNEWYI